jgi:hypothetical protein
MAIKVNRAPVMTLWAAVVAEHLGFDEDEALTMGRVVAGLNAHAKGKALGLYAPHPKTVKEERRRLEEETTLHVALLHWAVPVVRTPAGLRAVSNDKPVTPESVQRYLLSKFKEALPEVKAAMDALAATLSPSDLATRAYELYEQFRPVVPAGVRGWGAVGEFDLEKLRSLGRARP